MMLRKPTCSDCPHNLQYMERLPIKKKGVTMHLGERFCVAGKRARKFKRSDPKTYVPSWCPRLKAPCELRIYGLKNQREWRMHRSMCAYLGEDTSPSAFRYAVRYEGHTDLAPYEFFECCNEKSDDEILGAAVQHYDVVEIDDGIKPAFFYKTEHGYELLFSFDAKTAKKNSVAEREELVEMIAIALLTRKNLFVLGEPGQAKSYAINLFRRHITGARQFERLLSKQSDEEQLFGRVDLASLLPGSVPPTVLEQDATYQNQRFNLRVLVEGIGSMKDEPATWEKLKSGTEKLELYRAALSALHKSEPTVQTAGKIPEADIVLLDEIFKCNDGVLNSLLTALNERKYTNEGRTYPIPVISFFAASNEIPNFNDPQEKILEALYDRLELKVVTANIEDRGTRLAVLKNKQTGAFGQISATITLEELRQMQQEVASIPVPDAINELADDILCELRKDMAVSDRKYLGYYPIAQAKAWLSGHDKVESCDLLALKNYLWRLPSDREKVEAVLTRLCVNPMQDKVNDIRGMALESQEEFDAALGDGSKADTARKAFIKLRGELTHLYQMQCSLRTAAQSDSETALVDDLLADLEKISRKAHEQTHFTYTTLEEIAALN